MLRKRLWNFRLALGCWILLCIIFVRIRILLTSACVYKYITYYGICNDWLWNIWNRKIDFPALSVRDALSFFAFLERWNSVAGLDLIVSNIIVLGTMTYLLLYGVGLRWLWRQIQPIIFSHWQRDPQDCWSLGSSSQIHLGAAVLTGPAAAMVAAMGLVEIFNSKGLGSPQSSLLGELRLVKLRIRNAELLLPFFFTQLKIQHDWILAYLKKWYAALHDCMYVITVNLCALNISLFKHINNSVHSYFLPSFSGPITKSSNYSELILLISYRGL